MYILLVSIYMYTSAKACLIALQRILNDSCKSVRWKYWKNERMECA